MKRNKLLIRTTSNGDMKLVQDLISNGANIHTRNDLPLCEAARYGHLDIVEYLIDHGANVHTMYDTPLNLASMNGHLDIVKCLMKYNPSIVGNDFRALNLAAYYGHLDIVKYIVENNKDIQFDFRLALVGAAENNHIDIVKYLVENCDVDVNAFQGSALRNAARQQFTGIVEYLISHGATPNHCNGIDLEFVTKCAAEMYYRMMFLDDVRQEDYNRLAVNHSLHH